MSGAAGGPAIALTRCGDRLAGAWQQGTRQYLGLLTDCDGRVEPEKWLHLPTRAHGVLVEPDGSLLAFARRPGDWLVRWHPFTGRSRWQWLDEDRRLNGHGAMVDARWIVTTETDRETDRGWLSLRHRATLEPIDAWPTHGVDPHQVLALPQALGRWPKGTLIVANGGVSTRAETGRSKVYGERLDASLVALDPKHGALLGQWRLDDPYLSIRHLAWNPRSRSLGIALQAEHASEAERSQAPVLAVWDGDVLHLTRHQPPLGGYGGDIIAVRLGTDGGFAVACTRGNRLALFAADGHFVGAEVHTQSGALASDGHLWWNAGLDGVLSPTRSSTPTRPSLGGTRRLAPGLQIDNHWQAYRSARVQSEPLKHSPNAIRAG